ncbi:MAG: quinone oxidoreductase [Steroidobacteraceae bacterium]
MKTRAVVLRATGAASQLAIDCIDLPAPQRGEVRIRHTAIGLNFIDIYQRRGLYPLTLPAVLGHEAAGVVTQLGPGVRSLRVGDRIAYVHATPGAYCDERVLPASQVLRLPRAVRDRDAAAIMLKGLTAWVLLRRLIRLERGDFVLVHAAAGGVGSLLCQWARHLGARVIGLVGDEGKVAAARRNGCRHVLLSRDQDWPAALRQLTGGQGARVVYDSVGKDTFMASLDCLAPLGLMVSYGNASGPPPAISPLELMRRGSIMLARPSLFHFIAKPTDLARGARELFALLGRRELRVRVGHRYPLAQVTQAHEDLESRRTTGASLLLP